MRRILSTLLFALFPVYAAYAEICPGSAIDAPATTPASRFDVQPGGETIVDKQTGLEWAACPIGYTWDGVNQRRCVTDGSSPTFTWTQALLYVLGHPDYLAKQGWRIPNVKELASIVEYKCHNPAINHDVFPSDVVSGIYWSNTHWAGDIAGDIRVVNFDYGVVSLVANSEPHYLRLVRDADNVAP